EVEPGFSAKLFATSEFPQGFVCLDWFEHVLRQNVWAAYTVCVCVCVCVCVLRPTGARKRIGNSVGRGTRYPTS
ncbi:unnamed protein product, partial [Hapterophycus canaliculatus]